MSENMIQTIATDVAVIDDNGDDALVTTYVKFVKVDKETVRVETKDAEDLDSWPTYVGEMSNDDATAMAAVEGWTVVPSWQSALKLEGWTKPWPRTTLV